MEIYEQEARTLLQGVRRIQIEREFFRQRPCGAHLQEVRRTACRPAVRDDDPPQAVESAVQLFAHQN